MKLATRWLAAFLLLFIFVLTARAQGGGTISGVVNDEGGAALEGAVLTLTNVATGVEKRTTTDAAGRYTFDDVTIGIYRFRVQKLGFSEANRNVSVSEIGEKLQANFELAPGGITESVTVTASRGERDVMEIPVRADSVTPEILQRTNPATAGDALLNLPNVTAVNNGPFQIRPRLRGLDSSRVLVMVDGERLNTARVATDRAGVEIGLVDPSLIENIEVIYGSGSVLYGTDALSGTINIITDTPRRTDSAIRLGGGFNGYYSSNEPGRRGTARVDVSGRKFAIRSSFELERYSNYHSGEPFTETNVGLIATHAINHNIFGPYSDTFNEPYTRTSSEIVNSQAHGSDVNVTGRWFPTENQNLRIALNRRRAASIGFPDFSEPIFFQVINTPFSNLDKASARYELRSLTSWLTRLSAGGYWQQQDRKLRNLFTVLGSTPPAPGDIPVDTITMVHVLSDTRQTVKSYGWDLQANLLLGARNMITTGLSSFRDHSRDTRTSVTDVIKLGIQTRPPSPVRFFPVYEVIIKGFVSQPQRVPISNFDNLAWFIQDEFTATRWLRFIGSYRLDHFKVETLPTTGYDPRLPGIDLAVPPIDPRNFPSIKGTSISRTTSTGDFGFVVQPNQSWSFSARIGRSFRHPNLEELFFTGPATVGNIVANINVKPESGVNVDVSAKVRTNRYAGGITYFNNTYTNFISTEIISNSPTAGLISQAINFAKIRIQGVEADLQVPVNYHNNLFTFYGNLGFQHGQILAGTNPYTKTSVANKPADNITPFKSLLGLRWNDSKDRFWGEYDTRITTHVNRVSPLLSESPFLIAQDVFSLYGFTIHAIRGGYNFKSERSIVGITLAVENLGNKYYRDQFQFAPSRGRSFTLGLNLRLL